ncbi:MAG TPA: HAD-IA family hydrolase [Gemmatimonadales bacterium]|nr:HAD-IA family hydrolase [Gemmatimonadales bacterium]
MRTRVSAVLLDLDGTLIDTWALYIECYLRTLEPYAGRRLTYDELRALHPSSELRAFRRAVPAERVADAHAEFLRYYRLLHAELCGGVYPGVPDALAALRASDLAVGLVTGKSHGAWAITRELLALGDFAVFVGDEDVAEPKPSPEGLRIAVQRLGVEAGEAVYVGDSVNDAAAARDAGLRFVAALWAKSAEELPGFLARLREFPVWAEAATPADLVGVVLAV